MKNKTTWVCYHPKTDSIGAFCFHSKEAVMEYAVNRINKHDPSDSNTELSNYIPVQVTVTIPDITSTSLVQAAS